MSKLIINELPAHFATEYWLEAKEPKIALQNRPGHGYLWASPALSYDIYPLIVSELLDKRRRDIEYYPIVPEPNQRGPSASFKPLPPANTTGAGKAYAALVIDCEMVGLEGGVADLVRVSVIDFLTGHVVLDSLVQPTGRVTDWRSRVSGVDHAILRAAKDNPRTTVLQGWLEAREKIFNIADADTVLLGHALANDLKILRIVADRVVDSLVLTAQGAFGRSSNKFPRQWSLKSACKDLMGVEIQQPRMAHDPLEDALATREVIIWCLSHPEKLLEWGKGVRSEYEKAEAARREKQRLAALKRAEEKKLEQEAAEAAEFRRNTGERG